MKVLSTFVLLIVSAVSGFAQKLDFSKLIDAEQDRIDLFDLKADKNIVIGNKSQSQLANKVYFKLVDQLQSDIAGNGTNVELNYKALIEFLKLIDRHNVYHLTAHQHAIELANKIMVLKNDAKELELLKTDL